MKNYQEAIVTLKNGLKKYGKIVLEETENGSTNALSFFTIYILPIETLKLVLYKRYETCNKNITPMIL